MFTLLKTLSPIGKAVWAYAKPAVSTAGQIAIAAGTIIATTEAVRVVGKGLGKGVDGVRHLVGYEDNLFSTTQPTRSRTTSKKKKVKRTARKGNTKTASGNRKKEMISKVVTTS